MELMRGIDWYIMCIYQIGNGPYPSGTVRTQYAQCVLHWMELGMLTAGRSQRERVALEWMQFWLRTAVVGHGSQSMGAVTWVQAVLNENGSFSVLSGVQVCEKLFGIDCGPHWLRTGRSQWSLRSCAVVRSRGSCQIECGSQPVGTGRSQRRQNTICSVFSHQYK